MKQVFDQWNIAMQHYGVIQGQSLVACNVRCGVFDTPLTKQASIFEGGGIAKAMTEGERQGYQ
jgi:hypothetical protein